jgi:putative transposase
MPRRNVYFADGEIYHIFNRGVAKMPIFKTPKYYQRFLNLVNYYRFANLPLCYSSFIKLYVEQRDMRFEKIVRSNDRHVAILAFCLMPNHFHFLLRQIGAEGITHFMRYLQNGYTKYFNLTSNRVGPLYQSAFKAVRIESDEQLLHVSRYIHLNPSTAYLLQKENLHTYQWSSLNGYLEDKLSLYSFVDTNTILSFFRNKNAYGKFVYDQIAYQRELHIIRHLLFK